MGKGSHRPRLPAIAPAHARPSPRVEPALIHTTKGTDRLSAVIELARPLDGALRLFLDLLPTPGGVWLYMNGPDDRSGRCLPAIGCGEGVCVHTEVYEHVMSHPGAEADLEDIRRRTVIRTLGSGGLAIAIGARDKAVTDILIRLSGPAYLRYRPGRSGLDADPCLLDRGRCLMTRHRRYGGCLSEGLLVCDQGRALPAVLAQAEVIVGDLTGAAGTAGDAASARLPGPLAQRQIPHLLREDLPDDRGARVPCLSLRLIPSGDPAGAPDDRVHLLAILHPFTCGLCRGQEPCPHTELRDLAAALMR